MTITDQQVADYVADGYLVVRGLLSAEEVELGRAEALRFARGDYPLSNAPDVAPDATDEELIGSILAVHFPHWVSDASLGLVEHRGIADVLARITGAHLPFWDGRVKCMQSMLFLKPPGLQGQAWHQDERFIPTRDRSLIGAWIALDDADAENGALWILPGSHRMGYLHPTRPHTDPDEFDPSDEAFGFDDSAAVLVDVRAGDVVFFNGYTLHRSFRNRSQRTRRALVNHSMNAWSYLPWMMSQGIDVGTQDYRNVVPVAGDDPYAWKGYTDRPSTTFVRPHAGAATDARTVISTTVTIAAPIGRVWQILTEFDGYHRWNPAAPDSTVTVLDEPHRMVWSGGMPDPVQLRTERTWDLTAIDASTTEVVQTERFHGALARATVEREGHERSLELERFDAALVAESERRN